GWGGLLSGRASARGREPEPATPPSTPKKATARVARNPGHRVGGLRPPWGRPLGARSARSLHHLARPCLMVHQLSCTARRTDAAPPAIPPLARTLQESHSPGVVEGGVTGDFERPRIRARPRTGARDASFDYGAMVRDSGTESSGPVPQPLR